MSTFKGMLEWIYVSKLPPAVTDSVGKCLDLLYCAHFYLLGELEYEMALKIGPMLTATNVMQVLMAADKIKVNHFVICYSGES